MRENIKNGNSSLIIKSMNNLPIYDVIQIKINVLDTCTFLANFDKEYFTQEIREKLISKIKLLKDDAEPTLESQKIKISKLIGILNEVNPLFVTYKQHGDINVTFDDLKNLEASKFMLIVLGEKEKEPKVAKVKEPKPVKEKAPKVVKEKEPKVVKQKEPKIKKEKPVKESHKPEKQVDTIQKPHDISKKLVILPIKNVKYTGEVANPEVIVKLGFRKLVRDRDYIVHTDDFAPGYATAVVEFIGEYEKTPQFELEYFIIPEIKEVKIDVEEYDEIKKEPRKPIDFKLYNTDYLFISIFTLLFGFGVYTSVFELLIKDSMAAILFVLSGIFLFVLYFSFYSAIFKRRIERHKYLKYWLLTYIVVGAALGILTGYLITTFAMKIPEDASLNMNLLLGSTIPTTLVLSLISPIIAIISNLVIKKIKHK